MKFWLKKRLDLSSRALEAWMEDERQIVDTNIKITTTATPFESMSKERNFSFDNADRLDSWKEIACYLNRNVRTVQRWEAFESMPVHRHLHTKSGSVHAFRSELDAWRKERTYCRPRGCGQTGSTQCSDKGWINDKEQALLRTVLEAILVQLTTQTTSAVVDRDGEVQNREITGELLNGGRLQGTFDGNRL